MIQIRRDTNDFPVSELKAIFPHELIEILSALHVNFELPRQELLIDSCYGRIDGGRAVWWSCGCQSPSLRKGLE
jgi:hypothetical protein